MSHYVIMPMYAHFFMVPMHVTLQNGTNYGMHGIINVCHTTYYIYIYSMVPMHVTLYGMVTIYVTL